MRYMTTVGWCVVLTIGVALVSSQEAQTFLFYEKKRPAFFAECYDNKPIFWPVRIGFRLNYFKIKRGGA